MTELLLYGRSLTSQGYHPMVHQAMKRIISVTQFYPEIVQTITPSLFLISDRMPRNPYAGLPIMGRAPNFLVLDIFSDELVSDCELYSHFDRQLLGLRDTIGPEESGSTIVATPPFALLLWKKLIGFPGVERSDSFVIIPPPGDPAEPQKAIDGDNRENLTWRSWRYAMIWAAKRDHA